MKTHAASASSAASAVVSEDLPAEYGDVFPQSNPVGEDLPAEYCAALTYELVKDGLLKKEELPEPVDSELVNYAVVAEIKDPLIAKAAERLIRSEGELKSQLEDFHNDPDIAGWLEDAAYFAAIDSSLNALSWYEWPEPLKNRHLSALEDIYQTTLEDFLAFWAVPAYEEHII